MEWLWLPRGWKAKINGATQAAGLRQGAGILFSAAVSAGDIEAYQYRASRPLDRGGAAVVECRLVGCAKAEVMLLSSMKSREDASEDLSGAML